MPPNDHDNLSAYLDGELDDVASERIDGVLAQSNVAQMEVDRLAQTYDLLDVLPRYEATDEFTEKTVATIKSRYETRLKRIFEK